MKRRLSRFWCGIRGHKEIVVGAPIIHRAESLIETDVDCIRCGMRGTTLIPWKGGDTTDVTTARRNDCIAFATYVMNNWEKLAMPAPIHYEEMYSAWQREKAGATELPDGDNYFGGIGDEADDKASSKG